MEDIFKNKPLRVLITGRNLDDLLPLLKALPVLLVDREPDLVISHGGDGSLLGAERDYPGIPKFPLRDQQQNPKCSRHSELSSLEKLFKGELTPSYLPKLIGTTERNSVLQAVNDLVLTRELISSAIRYRLWIDGELYRSQMVSDSLVISTVFGSTGYFQSITRGCIQTGIGLAFNNARDNGGFVVVPETASLRIQLLRGPAILAADNNPELLCLDDGATLQVQMAEHGTQIYGMDIFRCPDCYQLRRDGIG